MKTVCIFSPFLLSLLFLSLISPSLSERCNADDKKVLLQIKEALNNPYHLASWIADTDCCDWYDVECDSTTNRIIELSIFADDKVIGRIPDAVGDLPYLQTLRFHKLPNITGPIPKSIAKLTRLVDLDLSWNSLSGPVPSFLSVLKNLEFLDLSFNQFTGSIPPSLSQLTKLLGLQLSRNKLTGSIPESFGNFGKNTTEFYLYLSHNQLTGSIPKSFAGLNLTYIDVSRNMLSGDASFIFGSTKTALQHVDLSRNMFKFDMTNVVFPESVIYLDLNHNMIYGSLPERLTKLELQGFNVSYNRLCGPIPVGGKLQSFTQYEYLHNKCLCGSPLAACK